MLLTDEDSVADSQVFNQILALIRVEHDLEMTASVLLCCLLVLAWDHKVVDNTFLYKGEIKAFS